FTEEEITRSIHYPSLISDALLLSLGLANEERKDLSILYSDFSDDLEPNKGKYEKYANGLALRFINVIKTLEDEHRVELVRHFLLEWEQIHQQHSCYIFRPHNFSSDQFYPQDKIGCSF